MSSDKISDIDGTSALIDWLGDDGEHVANRLAKHQADLPAYEFLLITRNCQIQNEGFSESDSGLQYEKNVLTAYF